MHLVRVYRQKQGMTISQLARDANVNRTIIIQIESNPEYNAKRTTMLQVSNALGLPPSMLFFPQQQHNERKMLSNMLIHLLKVLEEEGKLNTPLNDSEVFSAS